MLTEQHWPMLGCIMLKDRIYNKSSHRNIFEEILFRMRTGCPWQSAPKELDQ